MKYVGIWLLATVTPLLIASILGYGTGPFAGSFQRYEPIVVVSACFGNVVTALWVILDKTKR